MWIKNDRPTNSTLFNTMLNARRKYHFTVHKLKRSQKQKRSKKWQNPMRIIKEKLSDCKLKKNTIKQTIFHYRARQYYTH